MNAYSNKNTGKYLAIIMALAMVIVGFAVVSSDDVSADPTSISSIGTDTFTTSGEYKLSQDVTISGDISVDMNGSTLDLDGHTITMQGATLTDSKESAKIVQNGTPSDDFTAIIVSSGKNTVSHIDFEKTAETEESSAYQFIAIGGGESVTITDVSFTADDKSKMDGTFFAISANAADCEYTITDVTLNGGAVKYACNGAVINFTNTRNITLNIVGGSMELNTECFELSSSNISRTILGWMGNPDGKATAPGDTNLKVVGDINLGTVDRGEGNEDSAQITLDVSDPNSNISYNAGAGVVVTKNNSDRTGIDNNVVALEGDIVIDGEAYLVGDVTIPADKTIIIRNGGSLDLNKNDLILFGDLVVENRGSVIGTDGTEKIVLKYGSSIQNDGAIGGAMPVSVYADKTATMTKDSYVTLQNVIGVSFGLIRSGDAPNFNYTLSVTGDVKRASGTSSSDAKSLTINNATVNGELSTTKDVVLDGVFTISRNGSVIADGEMNATVTMQNGASITVNGAFDGTINAQAKEGMNSAEANDNVFAADEVTKFTSTGTGKVTGFTVSVDRVQYTDDDGNVMFNQRAYLSGNVESTDKTVAELTIEGNAFVADGVTVTIDADNGSIAAEEGTGLVIVDGTIVNVANEDAFSYVGAYYTQTAQGETDAVGYITSFDAAMGNIANADDDTIVMHGDAAFSVQITGTYTVEDGQRVESNGVASLVIAESGRLTVNDGGEFDAAAIKSIEGMVTVMYGGDCEPADDLYDVKSENENGDITYAGLQVVLSNAQSGDVITVTGPNAHATTLTVPNGVTLNIEGMLTVDRSVTVAEGGVLNLVDGGQLSIGKEGNSGVTPAVKAIAGTLTVNGTADITEGTLKMVGGSANANEAKATISSVGSLVYIGTQLTQANTDVNGAYYINSDADYVLTTVSAAVAGALEAETVNVTVIGTVNDTTDVTLGGVKLDIKGKATLGNIDVVDSILTVTGNGQLTATVIGQSGEEGSTVPAAIQLNKAVIVNATSTDAVNSQNVNVWTLTFTSITGTATITQGTVVASSFTGTQDDSKNVDTLTVASGATLLVNKAGVEIETYKQVDIAGTLEIAQNGYLTVSSVDKMVVSGTMDVSGIAAVTDMIVTGVLNVTDTDDVEGTMNVSGELSVGEASKTLGATGSVSGPVALNGTTGYVLAYPGTTVDASSFGTEDAVKSTEFYINGTLYVTAYALASDILAIGTVTNPSGEGFMNDVEITGYVTSNGTTTIIGDVEKWFSDDVLETPLVENGTAFNIGGSDAAYIELDPATVYIQYSAGSQISLFVDGVRVTSGDIKTLSVGTHQVVATVNPGFTGDVTITFNGQTVTGEFTVTPEMVGNTNTTPVVLSATGNITQDVPSTSGGDSGSNDGMGLTDYLLIILVVLIVIMAIMVAMRLMRS